MLSALANLPDPTALAGGPAEAVGSTMGGVNLADSPSPLATLAVAVAASAIAGIVLAPLDLVRTRYVPSGTIDSSPTDHVQTNRYTNIDPTPQHSPCSPLPPVLYRALLSLPNHPPQLHPPNAAHLVSATTPPLQPPHRRSHHPISLQHRLLPHLDRRALPQTPAGDAPPKSPGQRSAVPAQVINSQFPTVRAADCRRAGSVQGCLRHGVLDRLRRGPPSAQDPHRACQHDCQRNSNAGAAHASSAVAGEAEDGPGPVWPLQRMEGRCMGPMRGMAGGRDEQPEPGRRVLSNSGGRIHDTLLLLNHDTQVKSISS